MTRIVEARRFTRAWLAVKHAKDEVHLDEWSRDRVDLALTALREREVMV